jgi:hypothetical protein
METRLELVTGLGAPKTFGPVYQSCCVHLRSGGSFALAGWFPAEALTQGDPRSRAFTQGPTEEASRPPR